MQRLFPIGLVCGLSLLMAACLPLRRTVEPSYGSLKDDAPPLTSRAEPRSSALPAPSATEPSIRPLRVPRGSQDIAADERAREEQRSRCAQRHVDYQAGKLNETVEQKQIRDQICAELHRGDHARDNGR